MKILPFLFVLVLVMGSCSSDDPKPIIEPDDSLIPELFEGEGLSKQFIYNDAGQLVQIKFITRFANGATMESYQNFFYHSNGQLKELITDTGYRMVYTFENNRIIRTDEYVYGSHSQYHIHTYDNKGRLTETTTWQNIPEEGGEIPVAQDAYEYDAHSNVTTQRLYYYTSFGAEKKLLTVITFSDYDDKTNSEDRFDVIPNNPLVSLRKNNPGKMEIRNANGVLGSTELYTYEYHALGYATRKTATVTFNNGNQGTYQSTYKFKE